MALEQESPFIKIAVLENAFKAQFLSSVILIKRKIEERPQYPSLELARAARISLRTLHRRKQGGRLLPEESERVFRIACVFDKAVDVLGGLDAARKWFKTPLRALAGKTPLEYCDMEIGLREVELVLGRIERGVFS
jgi:putative toxin-antitoxin system antitoxin component (TIGR02293 family)